MLLRSCFRKIILASDVRGELKNLILEVGGPLRGRG